MTLDSSLDLSSYFAIQGEFWFEECLLTPITIDLGDYTYTYNTATSAFSA